jgi:hypothetical protein
VRQAVSTQTSTGAAPSAPKGSPSIYALAQAAFEQADGDPRQAALTLIAKIGRNRALREELAEEFVRTTCMRAARDVLHSERAKSWLPPNYDAGGKGDRVKALARSNTEMLLNFPLDDGTKLRDATREQIEKFGTLCAAQGKTLVHRGMFLLAVAAKLKPGQKAGRFLTEKDLQQLRKETANVS